MLNIKWCWNNETRQFEEFDEYGYSYHQQKVVADWDDAPFREEKEEERRRREESL